MIPFSFPFLLAMYYFALEFPFREPGRNLRKIDVEDDPFEIPFVPCIGLGRPRFVADCVAFSFDATLPPLVSDELAWTPFVDIPIPRFVWE